MSQFDILMPAFNAAQTIAESIESVQRQTFSAWELWIVNDGSTDETSEAVRPFLRDPRIHLIEQENQRLGAARNAGLREGTAPLVCFLDSDDLWEAPKLERQFQAHEEHDASVSFSDGEIFWDAEPTRRETFGTARGFFEPHAMLRRLLLRNQLPVLSVAVRREAIERAGGFDETAAFHGVEDYDLWLRLAEQGASFYGINASLVRYRRHAQAMTLDLSPHVMLREINVWERHFPTAQALGLGDALAAKLRVYYHGAALKLVKQGDVQAAVALLCGPDTRRWDNAPSKIKRAVFQRAPRLYVAFYDTLAAAKRQAKRVPK